MLAARQAFRNVLRFEEGQDRLVVAVIEIVGLGKGLGPWFAVTIADLQQPRSVALVAPVLHLLAARELRAGIRPAPDGELKSCGSALQTVVALPTCHALCPRSVPNVWEESNEVTWDVMRILLARSRGCELHTTLW